MSRLRRGWRLIPLLVEVRSGWSRKDCAEFVVMLCGQEAYDYVLHGMEHTQGIEGACGKEEWSWLDPALSGTMTEDDEESVIYHPCVMIMGLFFFRTLTRHCFSTMISNITTTEWCSFFSTLCSMDFGSEFGWPAGWFISRPTSPENSRQVVEEVLGRGGCILLSVSRR